MNKRRLFLKYMVTGTTATIAFGWLWPQRGKANEVPLEELCSSFPYNSRCKDYLPGVEAINQQGKPLQLKALLSSATPGKPIAVEGLSDTTYLVIESGPKLAQYGIFSVCPHYGCVVEWNQKRDRFVCPCHGSEFDNVGRVTQGPASTSLPLVMVVAKQNQIRLLERAPGKDPRVKL